MKKEEKLKVFLAHDADMGKMDDLLETWVKGVKNEELRAEMAYVLEEEYGITKLPQKVYVLKHIRPVLAVAASIAMLVGLFLFNRNETSPKIMAAQHLEVLTLQHPGHFKGVSKSDENRTQGIIAFNNGDYKQAFKYFEKISSPNDEDNYYLGLAYLKEGRYKKAVENLKTNLGGNSRFRQEANWFLSLAYLLDGKDTEAERHLQQIQQQDWRFDEARKLLNELKK